MKRTNEPFLTTKLTNSNWIHRKYPSTLMRGRDRCVLGKMAGETGIAVMVLASVPFEDTVTKSCPIGLPNGPLREVTSGDD